MWGFLIGAAFFWIPGIGPIAAAGPIVHALVGTLEGAAIVGGLSAVGAALAGLGVPKNSVVKYEQQLRADKYLVIAHGNADEVRQAHGILEQWNAVETEVMAA
jgi:hypothetical protein